MSQFTTITTSTLVKATPSTVPYRIVLSRVNDPTWPEKAYCTHMEVFPPGRPAYLVSGHYDMTYEEARADWAERVARS